jgi:site-specific DNA-adenine methylase
LKRNVETDEKMQYLGGKHTIRKWVADVVGSFVPKHGSVWEPFCGGLNSAIAHQCPVYCSDISVSLIAMINAVRSGWQPPELGHSQPL